MRKNRWRRYEFYTIEKTGFIYDVEEQKEMILEAIRVVMEYFFSEVSEKRPLRWYLKLVDEQQVRLRSVTLAPLCRGTLERNSLEQYLRSLGIKGTEVKQSEIVLKY